MGGRAGHWGRNHLQTECLGHAGLCLFLRCSLNLTPTERSLCGYNKNNFKNP